MPVFFPACLSQCFSTPWVFESEFLVGFELRLEGAEFGFDGWFHTAPLYEQIPDWCEATLADDSHAVLMRHDLADFFQLCFGHDDSLVFAEGWVVEQEGFEFFANGFSPTAFVRAEAVVLKR